MLTELEQVPDAALPVEELRDHLKLGTGFADADAQDGMLRAYLRAALAAIEGRIGKALFERPFLWRVATWREGAMQPLPLAPVTEVMRVTSVAADGAEAEWAPERYSLVPDFQRPKLQAAGGMLPTIPEGGHVEIRFRAGFGADWAELPVDLQQAILMLAARYYEVRHDGAADQDGGGLPFGVMALIERWRTVRVLGGGRT